MQPSTSKVTGEQFYSGDWQSIKNILRVLNIGEGKMAAITQETTENFQEIVDREIDAILESLYHVPLRAMNQVQPDGSTKRVFPGDIRRLAQYWVAGLMLMSEFQNLSQNITDQAQAFIEDSRKSLYAIIRFNHRIPGQEPKSHISKTCPAAIQPPSIPEPNF